MHKADPHIKRRILYLDHTAALGGAEIALLRLLSQLDRHRYDPYVVVGGQGDLCLRLAEIGVEAHVIPLDESVANARKESLGPASLLRGREIAHLGHYSREIARFIRSHRIALVHTNSLKADLIGGSAARIAGLPCIWHIRDRITADYLPPRIASMFRALCRFVPAGVVANSTATLDTLAPPGHGGRPCCQASGRFTVIYDGVAAPACVSPPAMTSPLVALIGRISPWKGQDVFIEAAARALRRFPRARFQIVGTALFGERDFERHLHERVHAMGLEVAIEFLGFLPDVVDHLRHVDIVVHASTLGEPFGQVVIEGMAAGRPVIATRGGAIPEIVIDGETGLLVPMGDANAMAEAMLSLLHSPARARRMGAAGRCRAIRCFALTRTARSFEDLYDAYLR